MPEISTPARIALLLTGCCVITAASRYGDFTGTKALLTFPLVAAACTLLLVATLGWPMRSERSWVFRAFTYLGRISYGQYIFHSPLVAVLGVASTESVTGRIVRTAAALLATIAVASASYRFFERPFLRLKQRFSRIHAPNPPEGGRAVDTPRPRCY
jgi:peptidoglycan/LPS O-acetylase OafA/YrhL